MITSSPCPYCTEPIFNMAQDSRFRDFNSGKLHSCSSMKLPREYKGPRYSAGSIARTVADFEV